MRKERLSIEELQALPKDAFPVTVECDDGHYTGHMKRVTFLNAETDKSNHVIILNTDGVWDAVSSDLLRHYPSLKPEVKKVKWYRVIALKRGLKRPYEYPTLCRSEQDFLDSVMDKKTRYHFIDLKEAGEWEDFEEVK